MGANPRTGASAPDAEQQERMDEIIDELEQLEKEISASSAEAEKPQLRVIDEGPARSLDNSIEENDEMADFRGASDEPSIEETLGELPEESGNEQSILAQAVKDLDPAHSASVDDSFDDMPIDDMSTEEKPFGQEEDFDMANQTDQQGCLSMVLKGSMTLELKYEHEGQAVKIRFEGGYLHVELDDGTEFKIPVRRDRLAA